MKLTIVRITIEVTTLGFIQSHSLLYKRTGVYNTMDWNNLSTFQNGQLDANPRLSSILAGSHPYSAQSYHWHFDCLLVL